MLDKLLSLDHTLSARLTLRRKGLVRIALLVIAHTGDGVVWIVIGTGLWMFNHPALALRELIAVAILLAVVAGLKFAFRRRRPNRQGDQLYFKLDSHSFPSGHAARVAALAVLFGAADPALLPAWYAWAVAVSLARVALGVHYLSDVAAGVVLGAGVGLILSSGL